MWHDTRGPALPRGRCVPQEVYIGEWQSGLRCGNGTLWKLASDGTVYCGVFHNGEMHGKGELEFPDGSTYFGVWDRGVKAGGGAWMLRNVSAIASGSRRRSSLLQSMCGASGGGCGRGAGKPDDRDERKHDDRKLDDGDGGDDDDGTVESENRLPMMAVKRVSVVAEKPPAAGSVVDSSAVVQATKQLRRGHAGKSAIDMFTRSLDKMSRHLTPGMVVPETVIRSLMQFCETVVAARGAAELAGDDDDDGGEGDGDGDDTVPSRELSDASKGSGMLPLTQTGSRRRDKGPIVKVLY